MTTGVFQIAGNNYIEKVQIFPIWLQNIASNALLLNQQVATPGNYMFRLKALTRLTVVGGVPTVRPFLFRLGGTSDTSWFTGGAVPLNTSGVQTDRILDSNMFGTGQFPFPLIPDILFPAGSNITFEVQDISNNGPYDLHLAFHGTYLVPLDSSTNTLLGG